MLVSIGTYAICDGTLTGGVAISDLRLRSDRLFDSVVPVGDVALTFFDRITSTTDVTFIVQRTFGSVRTAEKFILQLDTLLPASGALTFTTTGPSPDSRVIPNGFVLEHSLLQEQGATTFHQYHVVGGPPVAT
jgi:hypothetical protein